MLRPVTVVFASVLVLTGCAEHRAPSFYMAGSYFPAWLLCALAGILGSALVRVLFIKISLDSGLPARPLVYTCIALIIAMVLGLGLFY